MKRPDEAAPHDPAAPHGAGAPDDTGAPRGTVAARVVAAPIIAYRRWISPALPARCRFYPTCSTYALEAVMAHGPIRGVGLAIWRLLRCHPFHPGGYDPVPGSHRNAAPKPTST